MSTMTSNDDPKAQAIKLLGEARRWVVRMRSGEVTPADRDALKTWQNLSPAHRRALAEATAQWDALRVLARASTAGDERPTARQPSASRLHVTRRAWLGGAMAASIGGAVYLAARPPLGLWPSLADLNADYRTGVGEQREIVLAEAVSVEMNTRTSLAVPENGGTGRQIELINGEITVTAKSANLPAGEPFVVVARNGRTSAAQATFDLRDDDGMVTVTCLDGEVSVECQGTAAKLPARHKVAYGALGLGHVIETDPRVIEAWRKGLLVFDNQPLSLVIPEINRYRRGRIVLLNEEIGRLPLDATFRLDRIDEVVPKIAHIFDLKVRTLPGGLVLLG